MTGAPPETVASYSLIKISIIQHLSSPPKNLFSTFGSEYQLLKANETMTCLRLQRATQLPQEVKQASSVVFPLFGT